jgi:hypothetical protein
LSDRVHSNGRHSLCVGIVGLGKSFIQYSATRLSPLLSFGLARKELSAIYKKDGGALNPHVGGAAKIPVSVCMLLSNGIRISM